MHLVQLLLPVKADSDAAIAQTRDELVDIYDGVTAYVRSAARGAWLAPDGKQEHDDVIMVEVVVHTLDREWWREYRDTLAARFGEEQIHVRIIPAELV